MMAKHLQIRNDLQPPFVIEYAGKSAAQEKEEGEDATAEAAPDEGTPPSLRRRRRVGLRTNRLPKRLRMNCSIM